MRNSLTSYAKTSRTYSEAAIEELLELHEKIKPQIEHRLKEFEEIGKTGTDKQLFVELAFCLLTPQSKATQCWSAIECLLDSDLLMNGEDFEIAREIKTRTRFHNQKAKNVVLARELFMSEDVMNKGKEKNKEGTGKLEVRAVFEKLGSPKKIRKWLVKNIRGMGCKEASHYLRNIGMGRELAILDRHILKNLVTLNVIDELPTSVTPKLYHQIEIDMRIFCSHVGIRMDHLDLVLWYKQAGEVFK